MCADLFRPDPGPPASSATAGDRAAPVSPLADRMRPAALEDVVGQDDLLGAGRPLRRLIEADAVPSLILWGPPGCGKTTLARLIAGRARARCLEYSAVAVGTKELKETMVEAQKLRHATGRRTLIFLDEIHRFNKSQQDALLPWVERGDVTLIGATTENPSFELNAALLSRLRLFVLSRLTPADLVALLRRALVDPRGLAGTAPPFTDEALDALATLSEGDARSCLNLLETAALAATAATAGGTAPPVTVDTLAELVRRRLLRYDKAGEEHFNLISALHKSLRNSDAQASLYWMGRMLAGGEDPLYIARRLVRFASEDIGLADPAALPQALAARDALQFIGQPEGELALAQAVVYLALSPKSNALYTGYAAVVEETRRGLNPPVPLQLRNAPTSMMKGLGYGADYVYAHDTPEGVAAMPCLPPELADREFYTPTRRGYEATLADRLARLAAWRRRRTGGDAGQQGGDG
jgi:putative ATPase